jgi:hypothetical protein
VLRSGCSYGSVAGCCCGAATIGGRRGGWVRAGIFAELNKIARECYDRIAGLVRGGLAAGGCVTKAPGGGGCAGPSPADRREPGVKRSLLVGGRGIGLTSL